MWLGNAYINPPSCTINSSKAIHQYNVDAATAFIHGIDWYNTASMSSAAEHDWPVCILASQDGDNIDITLNYSKPHKLDVAAHSLALAAAKKRQLAAAQAPSGALAWHIRYPMFPRSLVDLSPEQVVVSALENHYVMGLALWVDTEICDICRKTIKRGTRDTHVYWGKCTIEPLVGVDNHATLDLGSYVDSYMVELINVLGIRPSIVSSRRSLREPFTLIEFSFPKDVAEATNLFGRLVEQSNNADELLYAGMKLSEFIRNSLGENRVRELAEASRIY